MPDPKTFKYRNFMCTINFDEKTYPDPLAILPDFNRFHNIKEATFQLERGHIKGRLHWQIFLMFKDPVNFYHVFNETKKQKLLMHVSNDEHHKHANAGRYYTIKYEAVDNHRYVTKNDKWYRCNPCWKNLVMIPRPPTVATVERKAHVPIPQTPMPPLPNPNDPDFQRLKKQTIDYSFWVMNECKRYINGDWHRENDIKTKII